VNNPWSFPFSCLSAIQKPLCDRLFELSDIFKIFDQSGMHPAIIDFAVKMHQAENLREIVSSDTMGMPPVLGHPASNWLAAYAR